MSKNTTHICVDFVENKKELIGEVGHQARLKLERLCSFLQMEPEFLFLTRTSLHGDDFPLDKLLEIMSRHQAGERLIVFCTDLEAFNGDWRIKALWQAIRDYEIVRDVNDLYMEVARDEYESTQRIPDSFEIIQCSA